MVEDLPLSRIFQLLPGAKNIAVLESFSLFPGFYPIHMKEKTSTERSSGLDGDTGQFGIGLPPGLIGQVQDHPGGK